MEILGGLLHLKLLRKLVLGEVFHLSTIFMLYDPKFPNNLKLYCPNGSITCTCYKIFTCHCSLSLQLVDSTRTTPSSRKKKREAWHTLPGVWSSSPDSASGLPLVCRFWSMKMAASAGPQRMEIARTRQNSMLTWWKNPADWRLKCHFMSLPLMIVHHRRSIFLLWWKYSTHPALTILLGFPKFEISITEATFRSTRYNQHATIAAPKWHSFWKGNLPIRKHSCFGPT